MVETNFKKTEIGLIPEDWDVKDLKDMVSLMTNGFVGTAKIHYTDFDNGILYIQGYNVVENSIKFNGIKSVTPEFHKLHQKSCLKEGDLLTVQTGDVGLTTFVPKSLEGSNCHALIISRFYKEKYFYKFYSFYLNSNQGRKRLKDIEVGTTMKHINVGDLLTFKVPIPNLNEQQAIAAALSDADAWIESLEKLIAKKRLIKQGALQQLLTPKEDWEVKKLGEVCRVVGGGTPSTFNESFWNGQIKWFTPTEVGYSKYLQESKRKISFAGLTNSSATILPVGTILMTSRAGIGDLGILNVEAATNQGFQSMICKENVSNEFLYYIMSTKKKELLQNASGSTFLEISPNKVKSIEIGLPTYNEQIRIANVLSDMDKEIDVLEQKLQKSQQIKQGMMLQLLTGKIRLVAANKTANYNEEVIAS